VKIMEEKKPELVLEDIDLLGCNINYPSVNP
jgi:hypothetical protein